MRQFAVFTEHLTVIGDDHDKCLGQAAVGAKRFDQTPDLRVRVRDLGVVRAVSCAREL
jgi:hypothetical protein